MRSGVTRSDISAAVGHKVFSYLEVTDDSDTFVNLGALAVGAVTLDFFNTATISESIDSNTLSFSAEVKNTIGIHGLSPLRTDSVVNESAATPGTYAPRLDLHRRWRIMVAVVAPGVTPVVPTDYRELNTGYVTDLKIGADVITIEGQGMEAPILSAFVIEDRAYASDDMEDVIQLALDEQFGTGIIPLSTPVSPSFLVTDTIGDINLMPALSDMAALAGWSLRYRYDSSDVNALTLFNPPRGSTTPDWTILDTEYERLDVELDEGPVRNFIVVKYVDATSGIQTVVSPGAETGTLACTSEAGTFSTSQAGVIADGARVVVDRTGLGDFVAYTVSAFDGTTGCTLTGAPDFTARTFYTSASITKYDLRVMVIDLSTKTQIVDVTAAGNLADAVRADREDPALVQSLLVPGCWFVQLHDVGATGANGVIYNDDQLGGVTSYTQHFADAMLETTINLAGSVKGRFTTWKRIGSGAGASQVLPEISYFSPAFYEYAGSAFGAFIYGLGYGPRCYSALVEYGLDAAFATGVTSIAYDEGTDNPVIGGFSLAGITDRDQTYYFRATPYSGPVVSSAVTGIAGDPVVVRVYVPPFLQDTASLSFDRSVAGKITGTVLNAPTAAPSGAAGGDLAGTYPNPTIKSSVALSGSPTTTTQSAGDNSTKIATTAYVDTGLATKQAAFGSQSANTVYSGPTSGGSAAPAFRALVAADIPSLDAAKITSGVLAIGRLATGTPDGTKFVRDDGTLATPTASVGWRYAMSRGTIASGNYADCVSAAFANPGAVFLVDVTVTRLSFRAAAHFVVPVQDIFAGSGSWGIVRSQQITTSGSVIGLEAQNSAPTTLSLRVRNDDSLNFDTVTVVVTCLSENAPTFATLSATGAVSTTAYWGQDRVRLTALEQGGATSNQSLIWDDTNKKWVAGGAIPTGSAGGDLTGSYPSPTLVTTAVTPGTYGDSTHAPQITIDAKGRVVAAANVAVSGGGSTDWTRLFQTTLGANAATISIPATISASYKNLVLIVSGRTTGANGNERVTLQFNGDTGNNYDWLFDQNGAVTQTGYTTSYIVGGWVAGGAAPANYPGAAEVHIYDYAGTTFYKSCKTSGTLMNAASNGFHLEGIGFWKSTSAITSILLGLTSANSYIAGTVVTLYGQS